MPVKKTVILSVAAFLAAAVVFLMMGSPIDPLSYEPPAAPAMDGVLAVNEALRSAVRIADGQVAGPEDVAVDAEGRLYAGTVDGRIIRVTLDGVTLDGVTLDGVTLDGVTLDGVTLDGVTLDGLSGESVETFATTGGRPLGLHFDAAGNLVVADAAEGLLSIAPDGVVTTLATESEGLPFGFTDDLDIGSDGVVYFSDASSRYGHLHYLYDLLEARPHGRLLRYDPATGTTRVLLRDLYFANGIALSQDESFVLVNETYRYRIRRYWLRGPKAGTSDVFIDNLPGFPDGVSSNRRGTFWVALFTVRNPVMDKLHPSAFLKRQLAKLPRALWPKPEPYGFVLALDENGRIVRSLQDPTGEHIAQVTSAEEVGGFLYLGNLGLDYMSRLALE